MTLTIEKMIKGADIYGVPKIMSQWVHTQSCLKQENLVQSKIKRKFEIEMYYLI